MNTSRSCIPWVALAFAIVALCMVATAPALCVSLLPGWPQTTGGNVRSSPALADLDGGGDLEIVVGCDNKQVFAWRHDGTPVEGWPQTTAYYVFCSPAVGDIDGDSDAEVICGSDDGMVYAWHHTGTLLDNWPQAPGAVASAPALGDLDNDGRPEVVVGCTNHKVYAWNDDGSAVAGWPRTVSNEIISTTALGDVDGDGRLEVVVGCLDGNVYAWNHDGSVLAGWPKATGGQVQSSPALGDIDGDHHPEIVVGSYDKKVYAWHANGTTVTGWPQTTGDYVFGSPALGDIDDDGVREVVVGSADSKVYAWNGNGTAVAGWPQSTGGVVFGSPALGDLDGDYDLEIVAGSWDNMVYAWHGDGSPVAGWPQDAEWEVYDSPAVADIDGDGVLEVVAGSRAGKVFVWTCDAATTDPRPWPMFRQGVTRAGAYGGNLPGTISGQVRVRGTTTNIAGATVEARLGGVLKGAATTAANGVYSIPHLAPGTYAVTARKQGYVNQTKAGVNVIGDQTTNINFGLDPSGRVSGQVKDKATAGVISGATVTVTAGGVVKAAGATNASGVYLVETNLATGTYVVAASKTGYVTQTKANIAITQGATSYVNFNLDKVCLKGQVKQAGTTTSIAGATVAVYQGDVLKATALTNATGIYEIGGLATGTYTVVASKVGYVRQAKLNVSVTSGEVTYLNFGLAVSGKLKGQVKNSVGGAPIVGATVVARMGGVIRASAATTAPWGVYEIASDLPEGTYVVGASATGYVGQTRKDIVISAGATTYVNFNLQSRWTVAQDGDQLRISYGAGTDYPQYGALHLDSSYLRLIPSRDSGWGTSVILVPPLWSSGYHQGAPVGCTWEQDGADLILTLSANLLGLGISEEVRISPPLADTISATVTVTVTGDVQLDVRPGEAFKPVMLSSMHISEESWDAQSAFAGSQTYGLPASGWIIAPDPAVVGTQFGLTGGTSAWKTNAPTVEIALDEAYQICGFVMASGDPNDDNIGLWAASDQILHSYQYVVTATAP